ncbi:Serine/threonine-protein kinase pim-2 [Mycena indigotica]|uniref:Serine/threonine-protein kinase pim-2 n=1 Tax=Mycena indigotica TaxID=2126181 RepID=A0A8H6TFI4_9AGAR|nr:Serine/threonine-protein kinase pim-2 [Mycena indigotica]KAF7315746.1 Serine/threonine-protein kinase pim-2 [Mycena indigotica]
MPSPDTRRSNRRTVPRLSHETGYLSHASSFPGCPPNYDEPYRATAFHSSPIIPFSPSPPLSQSSSFLSPDEGEVFSRCYDSDPGPVTRSLPYDCKAAVHSPCFPAHHILNPVFACSYKLLDQLGSGGYGFVMTAVHRFTGQEYAVKFIEKSKVPDSAWMYDGVSSFLITVEDSISFYTCFKNGCRIPTEILLLRAMDHPNIVAYIDSFEDEVYFYLVQELHGSPWHKPSSPSCSLSPSSSMPSLSPSVSADSITVSEPATPPSSIHHQQLPHGIQDNQPKSSPSIGPGLSLPRPQYSRRPSHDLFECIEQSENKRLSECQAQHVLKQVVEAVYYLDINGASHRDIKDENVVIDENLTVKLIDFGSAVVENPHARSYHTHFYGTTAYASPEILRKRPYKAAPAEVWTIGVLLSFLLTGSSPFPTVRDALHGRIILTECPTDISKAALDLMSMCLEPDAKRRPTIRQVRAHRWLQF